MHNNEPGSSLFIDNHWRYTLNKRLIFIRDTRHRDSALKMTRYPLWKSDSPASFCLRAKESASASSAVSANFVFHEPTCYLTEERISGNLPAMEKSLKVIASSCTK
ncbi:hypothetical protein ElyMa_000522500 [Elysia marginata]|uniref:Uncharacterized protein n=1 Tax=Elysia marginata TaxID=1093978 RepID=A0AAV4G031_9GAST|nr:hypothetical protein ElyMa_000522500 [Elysia marginata]